MNRNTSLNIVLRAIVGVFVFIFVSLVMVGNYFFDVAINNDNRDQSPVLSDKAEKEDKKEARKWFYEKKEEISTVSPVNGARLSGYLLKQEEGAETKPWIIFVHGYHRNATFYAHYYKKMHQLGYNIFTYDLNGHGFSEGEHVYFGGYDADDLEAWARELVAMYPKSEFSLFGVSMGATTVMNALAKVEDLTSIKSFVAYGGYVNLKDQLAYKLNHIYRLPSFPILEFTDLVTRIRAQYSLNDVDVRRSLGKNKKPALLIHERKDTLVPFDNLQKAYHSLKIKEKEKHSFPTDHTEAEEKHREAFWKVINKFWQKHFTKNPEQPKK